jgi:hypothetical protein
MDWNMLFYIALAAAILSLIFSTFVYGAKESMEVNTNLRLHRSFRNIVPSIHKILWQLVLLR